MTDCAKDCSDDVDMLVILVYRYLYAYSSMIFERLRADLEVNSGIILADKRQFNASTTASKKQRNDLCLGWCGLESFDSKITLQLSH